MVTGDQQALGLKSDSDRCDRGSCRVAKILRSQRHENGGQEPAKNPTVLHDLKLAYIKSLVSHGIEPWPSAYRTTPYWSSGRGLRSWAGE